MVKVLVELESNIRDSMLFVWEYSECGFLIETMLCDMGIRLLLGIAFEAISTDGCDIGWGLEIVS